MNNRIEETQEDQKGQEKIEFEDDINEKSNIVEPGITSEQHTTASSREHQIEKPRPEIGEEVPASTAEASCKFTFCFLCSNTTTTKPGCTNLSSVQVLCHPHDGRSGASSCKRAADKGECQEIVDSLHHCA